MKSRGVENCEEWWEIMERVVRWKVEENGEWWKWGKVVGIGVNGGKWRRIVGGRNSWAHSWE